MINQWMAFGAWAESDMGKQGYTFLRMEQGVKLRGRFKDQTVDIGVYGGKTVDEYALMEFEEHRRIIDYALQRIETYVSERLFETKGSTKGTEFLLQNTLGYATKSDISSSQQVVITEKERIKSLPDEEVQGRLLRLVPRIDEITGKKAQ